MALRWRLLVFDWDGTLMDSEAHIVAAVQAASRDTGLPVPAPETVRHVIGLGLREAVEAVLPGMDEETFLRFTGHYRGHFLKASMTAQTLFPGAVEVLGELRGAGFRLGIATGKGKQGLRRALEETKLLEYFSVTRCADETTSKPDPQMLQEILWETGLEASDALMIGDTRYDMEMAARIGMDRLAVAYGAHDRELLREFDPLGMLDDIRELPDWLRGQGESANQGSS